ncbi:MAG: hypothetical protein Q8M01_02545 [Rubrivivax sp.]|nr:hypothetical protein [Rubrivivax sp.]
MLPPRKLLRVSHVFVSHTHMDHFVGFDQFLRVVLGRKGGVVLYGGPGFVAQVEHKLRAYTWNVVHRYSVEFVLDVREIGTDGRGQRARFSSRTGFARQACAPFDCAGDVLHDEALFRVRCRFVDHEMPCLAFAIEEKARHRVAKDRLAALGVATGPWLRELKLAILAAAPAPSCLSTSRRVMAGALRRSRPRCGRPGRARRPHPLRKTVPIRRIRQRPVHGRGRCSEPPARLRRPAAAGGSGSGSRPASARPRFASGQRLNQRSISAAFAMRCWNSRQGTSGRLPCGCIGITDQPLAA